MAARKRDSAGENVEKREETFTLSQLLAAEKFSSRKDLLRALLSEDEKYSNSEVERKMEQFLKGKVR